MKTPEEYIKDQKIDDFVLKYMSGTISPDGIKGNYKERIYNAIKAAQIDAYNQALEDAAESAEAIEGWNTGYSGSAASVDKQSILKLKK
jgi:hypothetical protein